ncbi:MAG: hypothetical protein ACYTG0_25520 [Planctomycetota bacterium]|jgi:hypothetical protein
MSPLLAAVLIMAAPPPEGNEAPPVAESREPAPATPRTGDDLRRAARETLREWAKTTDDKADRAARELLILYRDLKADDQLSRSQREYYSKKIRQRLVRLSNQITKRIDRTERRAASRLRGTVSRPQRAQGTSASEKTQGGRQSPGVYAPKLAGAAGFGGGAMLAPDNGQQLVDLIHQVIQPDFWDVHGGPGSIYYWRPWRILVVRATGEVHGDVGDALKQLRRAGP